MPPLTDVVFAALMTHAPLIILTLALLVLAVLAVLVWASLSDKRSKRLARILLAAHGKR